MAETAKNMQQLQIWRNSSFHCVLFENDGQLSYETMAIEAYLHMTSPISRLVDL